MQERWQVVRKQASCDETLFVLDQVAMKMPGGSLLDVNLEIPAPLRYGLVENRR